MFALAAGAAMAGVLCGILDEPFVQIVAYSLTIKTDVVDSFDRFVDLLPI